MFSSRFSSDQYAWTLKTPSWDFSLMMSGFRRDTITILFVFIYQFQIKAMQITKTYCNFPKPPLLIYQSHRTSIAPFMSTLRKSPARQEGGERRKEDVVEANSLLLLFPHILRLPHSTTTITTETHCIWGLSCHVKILKCEWSPRRLSVCARSVCVFGAKILSVSPSVSQSNLASDAWCKHRVMRNDRGRQTLTVAMKFGVFLKSCILTRRELRIKHYNLLKESLNCTQIAIQ